MTDVRTNSGDLGVTRCKVDFRKERDAWNMLPLPNKPPNKRRDPTKMTPIDIDKSPPKSLETAFKESSRVIGHKSFSEVKIILTICWQNRRRNQALKMEAYILRSTPFPGDRYQDGGGGGGRHEKVDNGGRIYRTRTAAAHGKEEEERRGEEEAGRSHTTYALGRTGTHPCMHASLHGVSESCSYIKAHFMDALIFKCQCSVVKSLKRLHNAALVCWHTATSCCRQSEQVDIRWAQAALQSSLSLSLTRVQG